MTGTTYSILIHTHTKQTFLKPKIIKGIILLKHDKS